MKHAILSASSAHRWLVCPPSAQLEAGMQDSESTYAAEGTDAHELANITLKHLLGKTNKQTYTKACKKLESESEYFNIEMERCIVFNYCTKVMEIVGKYKTPIVDLEERVDFNQWVSGGFGTADVIIIGNNTLHVVDLKYGKGVPVSAERNPQLMLYALGACEKYDFLYDFKQISMTILQPRLDASSTYIIPATELYEWADTVVKPIASLAIIGSGKFTPSEEACRFCRARTICRARAEFANKVATEVFKSATLTVEEIAELLKITGQVAKWAKDIEEYALEQARDHRVKFPGWKLVEGRSVRKITNEKVVTNILALEGFDKDDYAPRKLLGIGDLEKLIGKTTLADLVGEYIVKPPGSPTLVLESDKRPELNSNARAAEVFT